RLTWNLEDIVYTRKNPVHFAGKGQVVSLMFAGKGFQIIQVIPARQTLDSDRVEIANRKIAVQSPTAGKGACVAISDGQIQVGGMSQGHTQLCAKGVVKQ